MESYRDEFIRFVPQFAEYINLKGDIRLLSAIKLNDNKAYNLYRSTGVNSSYPNTWFPISAIKQNGYLVKPPISSSLKNPLVWLKFTEPSEAEKRAVASLEEILIIKNKNGDYKLGFCNASGVYQEQPIIDEEFISWLVNFKNEREIQGTGFNKKIKEILGQHQGHEIGISDYPLTHLIEYYKNRYDKSFIEYLYVNQFQFKVKLEDEESRNMMNEFLCRFGNTESMCISYLIGGGFWETPEADMVKKFINTRYAKQLHHLNQHLGAQLNAFYDPMISVTFNAGLKKRTDNDSNEDTVYTKVNDFLNELTHQYSSSRNYDINFHENEREYINESIEKLNAKSKAIENISPALEQFLLMINDKNNLNDLTSIEEAIENCKSILNSKEESSSCETELRALQYSLVNSIMHAYSANVTIYSANVKLTFSDSVDHTGRMLHYMQDAIHSNLKQHTKGLFTWEQKFTTDTPPVLMLSVYSQQPKNAVVTNYIVANMLAESGLIDVSTANAIKQQTMKQVDVKKLTDNSLKLYQLQQAYNEISDRIITLRNERQSVFSMNKELKYQKIKILEPLALHLASILLDSDYSSLRLNEKLNKLGGMIREIESTSTSKVLEGKTMQRIAELKKILSVQTQAVTAKKIENP